MTAKLIKNGQSYKLKFYSDEDMMSCALGLLSLKNCQAIERGYDLNELVKSKYPNFYNEDYEYDVEAEMLRDEYKSRGFKEGFQKALKLMGDKKFTEEDIRNGMNWIMTQYFEFNEQPTTGRREHYIQSLQQTEWDVEIEMICPHPEDTYVCGIQYGCDEDGCNHPNKIPLLDADGYLILKLKSE